jgi:hypothetical protein
MFFAIAFRVILMMFACSCILALLIRQEEQNA